MKKLVGVAAFLMMASPATAQDQVPLGWFNQWYEVLDQLASAPDTSKKSSDVRTLLKLYVSPSFEGFDPAGKQNLTYEQETNPPNLSSKYPGSQFTFNSVVRDVADHVATVDITVSTEIDVTIARGNTVRGAVGHFVERDTWSHDAKHRYVLTTVHQLEAVTFDPNAATVPALVAERRRALGLPAVDPVSDLSASDLHTLIQERLRNARAISSSVQDASDARMASSLQSMKISDRIFQSQLDQRNAALEAAAEDDRQYQDARHEQEVRDRTFGP